GTFLGGLIHIGEKTVAAGRFNEPAAYKLSDSLLSLGFELGRLKTGTPPRIDGATVDFDSCQIQPGDDPIPLFSAFSKSITRPQIPCHLTYTSLETKRIISENLDKSAMFSGKISSTGPRYCPSIEDKVYRFADKESHQIFLEPEGNGTNEIYPNGFSTSLPEDVQLAALRTVRGLEKVVIIRPGYAVEYDYCPAHQIKASMETKNVRGLYFAGQINGTSGYEEAAGQGLMAGINASLALDGREPLILDRSEAYIGVMLDDLVTRSTTEPYRMFTSRAEHRLALREDNASDRMSLYAAHYGLLDSEKLEKFALLKRETEEEIRRLESVRLNVAKLGQLSARIGRKNHVSLADLLRMPSVGYADIADLDKDKLEVPQEVIERAAIRIRYAGYIEKQNREIARFKKLEGEKIPESFLYLSLVGLKNEAKEKFTKFRPRSLGQAGRIEGITSGDIAVLAVALKRHKAA
ncbi:MAG: tRNA uridine-5-carboxymethylaminomethyl(34) synthesis enzyme MnmG, partial [candidate division Zixibacteria bacterium]|nr:tRNA uridine-5-carboxymethylaminomethyl(34) synthesis enzyme MnmG [candidate division Zixibacteria bacterium]